MAMVEQIWELHRRAITEVETMLLRDAAQLEDLAERERQSNKIHADFDKLRDRNYAL